MGGCPWQTFEPRHAAFETGNFVHQLRQNTPDGAPAIKLQFCNNAFRILVRSSSSSEQHLSTDDAAPGGREGTGALGEAPPDAKCATRQARAARLCATTMPRTLRKHIFITPALPWSAPLPGAASGEGARAGPEVAAATCNDPTEYSTPLQKLAVCPTSCITH